MMVINGQWLVSDEERNDGWDDEWWMKMIQTYWMDDCYIMMESDGCWQMLTCLDASRQQKLMTMISVGRYITLVIATSDLWWLNDDVWWSKDDYWLFLMVIDVKI